MSVYIEKSENVAMVIPTSPKEFALACRKARDELIAIQAKQPKCRNSLDAETAERLSLGLEINRKNFEEGESDS